MSGNPVIGERVLFSSAFMDEPDQPARLKAIEDEKLNVAQIEILGGARDGATVNCQYDATGMFACCWHREGDPEKWAADAIVDPADVAQPE